MCKNSVPLCNITEYLIDIFPGETFEIEAIAVGQWVGIVPSIVTVESGNEDFSLDEGQEVQSVERNCSPLKYSIYSGMKAITLNIKAHTIDVHGPKNGFLKYWLPKSMRTFINQYLIRIPLKDCPIGFQLKTNKCLCMSYLEFHKSVRCDYKTFKILRDVGIGDY